VCCKGLVVLPTTQEAMVIQIIINLDVSTIMFAASAWLLLRR